LDYLQFEVVSFNYGWLALSAFLLWLGFVLSTFAWRKALNLHGIEISRRMAVVSHGLSVFAKYIPGKIWVILGRASYVAKKSFKVSDLSYISLKEQLLYILLGLLISFVPTLIYFKTDYWPLIVFVTIVGLGAVLFLNPIHDLSERILTFLFKKPFSLPRLSFQLSIRLSGSVLLYWAAWTTAFYTFMLSITSEATLLHSFAFPLSVCYGVLAIIMPGGIGVREGIMVGFLIATGVSTELVIAISVISRLWFMSGELFLFLLAFVISKKNIKFLKTIVLLNFLILNILQYN
jgi:uncharacterized membrane protein YbhN (UPF0104 family)